MVDLLRASLLLMILHCVENERAHPSILKQYFKYYELSNVTYHYEPVRDTSSGIIPSFIKVNFMFKGSHFETYLHSYMPMRSTGKSGIKVTVMSRYGKEVRQIRPLYYQGTVANYSPSFVHGTILNNIFTGSLYISSRIIYMEPFCNFVEETCDGKESLIYEVRDIIVNSTMKEGMEYVTKHPIIQKQPNKRYYSYRSQLSKI